MDPATSLLVAAAALASPQGADVDAVPDEGAVGALRHVQLLGVTESEPRTMRFVTSTVGGVALHERLLSDRSPLGAPEAILETTFEVLPLWSWSSRAPWRLLEAGDRAWLLSVDEEAEVLLVQSFPEGEEVARVEDASELEDARIRDGGIEILVRNRENVDALRLAPGDGSIVRFARIDLGLMFSAACFVEPEDGVPQPRTAFAATYDDGDLILHRIDLADGTALRVPTGVVGGGRALRLAARRTGDVDRIAVGTPMFNYSSGRVVLTSVGDGGRVGAARLLHPFGRPDDGHPGAWPNNYGQALSFTADADGDGLPDLAIGASYGSASEHVDLVSWAAGRSLSRTSSRAASARHRIGSSVSASPCGRYVLAAGGLASYPEWFEQSAEAVLLDVRAGRDPVVVSFLTSGR